MIHLCEAHLKVFRQAGFCEVCKAPVGVAAVGACDRLCVQSLFPAMKLDVPCNLITLCRPCQLKFTTFDRLMRIDLLRVVAKRENTMAHCIEPVLGFLKRLPADASVKRLQKSYGVMAPANAVLAHRMVEEIQKCEATRMASSASKKSTMTKS